MSATGGLSRTRGTRHERSASRKPGADAPRAAPGVRSRASAWVSANAGSGKTHVLAQRVVRLLLAGAPPSGILCLTFTKAAAANMSGASSSDWSKWTTLGDEDIRRRRSRTQRADAAPARRSPADSSPK